MELKLYYLPQCKVIRIAPPLSDDFKLPKNTANKCFFASISIDLQMVLSAVTFPTSKAETMNMILPYENLSVKMAIYFIPANFQKWKGLSSKKVA